mmetsp:Transcript_14216/g.41806  ORF Transcript_14216/g.41806 Transcript_14216/m.41806 type:complete len:613 (+) Transcript_14216:266-2104(+)
MAAAPMPTPSRTETSPTYGRLHGCTARNATEVLLFVRLSGPAQSGSVLLLHVLVERELAAAVLAQEHESARHRRVGAEVLAHVREDAQLLRHVVHSHHRRALLPEGPDKQRFCEERHGEHLAHALGAEAEDEGQHEGKLDHLGPERVVRVPLHVGRVPREDAGHLRDAHVHEEAGDQQPRCEQDKAEPRARVRAARAAREHAGHGFALALAQLGHRGDHQQRAAEHGELFNHEFVHVEEARVDPHEHDAAAHLHAVLDHVQAQERGAHARVLAQHEAGHHRGQAQLQEVEELRRGPKDHPHGPLVPLLQVGHGFVHKVHAHEGPGEGVRRGAAHAHVEHAHAVRQVRDGAEEGGEPRGQRKARRHEGRFRARLARLALAVRGDHHESERHPHGQRAEEEGAADAHALLRPLPRAFPVRRAPRLPLRARLLLKLERLRALARGELPRFGVGRRLRHLTLCPRVRWHGPRPPCVLLLPRGAPRGRVAVEVVPGFVHELARNRLARGLEVVASVRHLLVQLRRGARGALGAAASVVLRGLRAPGIPHLLALPQVLLGNARDARRVAVDCHEARVLLALAQLRPGRALRRQVVQVRGALAPARAHHEARVLEALAL